METALKNAFEIDKSSSIQWFVELSQSEKAHWFSIEKALFDLLPSITKEDKSAGVLIFQNLLKPEFDTIPSFLPNEKPSRRARVNRNDLWVATQKIRELFLIAPKEFMRAVLNLTLDYQNVSLSKETQQIQDVLSALWYYDESHNQAVRLLKIIERESQVLAINNDQKLQQVIEYLDSINYTIAIRLKCNILNVNPKKFLNELFDMINTVGSFDDTIDLLPQILSSIGSSLSTNQINMLDTKALTESVPNTFLDDQESFRKFFILSIPENLRTKSMQNWLDKTNAPDLVLRQRPIVFTSVGNDEEVKKIDKEFEKMNNSEQENNIIKSISSVDGFIHDQEKIDFLKMSDIYLNKEKGLVNRNVVLKLEPIIQKYCTDTDPEGEYLENDVSKHSIISYPSVRAHAASCILKLNWHNPTTHNLSIIKQLADDKHTFVREEVCRNLRFLSATDYPVSLDLAKKFMGDGRRLHFFIVDFLEFNVRSHTKDVFDLCTQFIKEYGKQVHKKEDEEPALDFVVSLISQMALKFNDEYFQPLFNELVEDASYNYTVKHSISFVCKSDFLLFDNKIKLNVLSVYKKLIESDNHKVRTDAEFFLLHSLVDKNKSYLPEIKLILESLSNSKYDLSSEDYYKLYIIDYIEKFWPESPDEFVTYLHKIYSNNKNLAYNFHKSREVIKLIEKMYLGQINPDSKVNLINILLEFVKAGWPEASIVLKTLESRST